MSLSCRCPGVRGHKGLTHTVHLPAPKCFCTNVSHWVASTRPPTGWSKKEAWPSTWSSSPATVTARLAFSLRAEHTQQQQQQHKNTLTLRGRVLKHDEDEDEDKDFLSQHVNHIDPSKHGPRRLSHQPLDGGGVDRLAPPQGHRFLPPIGQGQHHHLHRWLAGAESRPQSQGTPSGAGWFKSCLSNMKFKEETRMWLDF